MWLSWVRALHTADGTLRLSRPLLRALEEWGGKGGEREGSEWGKVPWGPAPSQDQPGSSGRAAGVTGEEAAGALVDTTTAEIGDGFADDEAVVLRDERPDVDRREGVEVGKEAAREGRGRGGGGKGGGEGGGEGGGGAVAVAETGESSIVRTTIGEPGAGMMDELKPSSSSSPTPAAQPREKLKVGEISVDDAEQATETVVAPVAKEGCRGHQEIIVSTGRVTGREPTSSQLERIFEAEREERTNVVELAVKLVADFGRFPPAEQEWKEVVEGEKEDGHCGGGGTD